jgi:DNA-directed RNA polymerase specialized sigma54-like protein
MTTKNTKPAVKAIAKAVKAVVFTKQEQIAIKVASAISEVGAIQSGIDAWCQELHKMLKGNKLGTVKSGDAVMIRFTETLAENGKSEQTVKNYATAFRKAVNEGVPFSMNAYRKPVKKGAQSAKSDEVKPVVEIKIQKDATEQQVADGLRQAVNDAKFRDKFARIASFLIDALDELDGE